MRLGQEPPSRQPFPQGLEQQPFPNNPACAGGIKTPSRKSVLLEIFPRGGSDRHKTPWQRLFKQRQHVGHGSDISPQSPRQQRSLWAEPSQKVLKIKGGKPKLVLRGLCRWLVVAISWMKKIHENPSSKGRPKIPFSAPAQCLSPWTISELLFHCVISCLLFAFQIKGFFFFSC